MQGFGCVMYRAGQFLLYAMCTTGNRIVSGVVLYDVWIMEALTDE